MRMGFGDVEYDYVQDDNAWIYIYTVYTYTCIYIYIYTHTFMHAYQLIIYMCIYQITSYHLISCVYIYIDIYIHIHTYQHVHTYVYMYITLIQTATKKTLSTSDLGLRFDPKIRKLHQTPNLFRGSFEGTTRCPRWGFSVQGLGLFRFCFSGFRVAGFRAQNPEPPSSGSKLLSSDIK